ncbi:MAG: hypothetical protein ACRELV_11205 [Longimicrobiales bacterium]
MPDPRDPEGVETPELGDALEPPPLLTLLEFVQRDVPPESVDQLWMFPPRRVAGTETAVVVLAIRTEDGQRRRVLTAHYSASRDRRGKLTVRHDFEEHGAAAPDRLDRVIDGVLRRLDETLPPHPPRTETIGGDPTRWFALLHDLRRTPPNARTLAWTGRARYQ